MSEPETTAPAADPSSDRAAAAARSARGMLLVAVSGSLIGWSIGWDFGAFGIELGYKRTFAILVAAVVTLVVSIVHPRAVHLARWTQIVLLLPVLNVIAQIVLPDRLGWVLLVFTLVSGAVLPVVLIVLARVLQIPILQLTRADQIITVVIVVAVTGFGAIAGHSHNRLVTCEEFERHGDYVPANCYRGFEAEPSSAPS